MDKIAVTSNALWIANIVNDILTQVDLESLRQMGDPIEIDGNMDQIVGFRDGVWILDKQAGTDHED